MRNAPTSLISGTASGTVTTIGIDCSQIYAFSMHGIWTAGGTGSIVIQASNDNVVDTIGSNQASGVTNWSPIASGTIAVSGAGNSIVNFDGIAYHWVRAQYTAAGGTAGTMTLNFFSKGT